MGWGARETELDTKGQERRTAFLSTNEGGVKHAWFLSNWLARSLALEEGDGFLPVAFLAWLSFFGEQKSEGGGNRESGN